MRKLVVLAAAVLGLTLTIAACGGGNGGGNGDGSLDVTMGGSGGEFTFTPSSLTASAGTETEVNITNSGTVPHSFVIEGQNVNSGLVNAGNTGEATFSLAAGSYTFFCDVPGHREAGMQGTLTVS